MLFFFDNPAADFPVSGGDDRVDSPSSSTASTIKQLDDPTVQGSVAAAERRFVFSPRCHAPE
jgi:hypothetical protein